MCDYHVQTRYASERHHRDCPQRKRTARYRIVYEACRRLLVLAGVLWKAFGQLLRVELALHDDNPWSSDLTGAALSVLGGTSSMLSRPEPALHPGTTAWSELMTGLIDLVKVACGKLAASPACQVILL